MQKAHLKGRPGTFPVGGSGLFCSQHSSSLTPNAVSQEGQIAILARRICQILGLHDAGKRNSCKNHNKVSEKLPISFTPLGTCFPEHTPTQATNRYSVRCKKPRDLFARIANSYCAIKELRKLKRQ